MQMTKKAAVAVAIAVSTGATLAAADVTVTPSALGGWATAVSSTATAAFIPGPGVPPLGSASVELNVGADGGGAAQLRAAGYAGTPLASLTTLEYSTYVSQDGAGGQAPYLILQVDLDGNATVDDLLYFEPMYQVPDYFPVNPQPAVALAAWQTWDALHGGWWSLLGVANATPGAGVKTLAAYLAAEPGATIANSNSGAGGIRVVAGLAAGAWENFVGSVDAVRIGVAGAETTYDFELLAPVPPPPPPPPPPSTSAPASADDCRKNGWTAFEPQPGVTFKNQGQCIRFVNTGKL